ncbi:hypothetical protein [Pantoea sp. BAV 3049]|uniref:hypothetical protein n=1 Tax=Pantoea sp. BAV 3049 TaxID=2654188 RepID=UPI00131B494D|nr:hypothetical protein [Pantoea sp. BAV 3049]
MRELNSIEIENVSGAGFFADLGKSIGSAIGSIVDLGTGAGGLNTDATTAAEKLGSGIGSLFELDFVSAISNIGAGIVNIVEFGIDAVAQIKAKNSA